MEYVTLGRAGIRVSRVSLGTMTFGDQVDEATSVRMIEMALDAGVNFIDEADVYVRGRSEEIVGKALKGKREKVVLASKVRNLAGEDRIKDQGLHRWHVIRGVEACLKRLQTDCLDICYLHKPDYDTPIEETLSAFDTLLQQGKAMYVGMSNYAAWQVCEALWRSETGGWPAPVVLQSPYNLITRAIEEECTAFCKKHSIGITAYNPLAGGLLTGKHNPKSGPIKGTRFDLKKQYFERYWSNDNFDAISELAGIADQAGKTLTELALQWLLSQSHMSSVILGATKIEHLKENLKAADGSLDEATLKACDGVWAKIRGGHFSYIR
jgi:aryl-alcohol dehydrogenase-like predicted oxidoreductase